MRKRDRIFIAPLLAVSLLFAAAPTALAAESGEQFVFDKADLLTTEEEDELNDMANNLAENFNMNFIILTTDDVEGKRQKSTPMISTWITVSTMTEKTAEPSTSSIWITAGFRWRLPEI